MCVGKIIGVGQETKRSWNKKKSNKRTEQENGTKQYFIRYL